MGELVESLAVSSKENGTRPWLVSDTNLVKPVTIHVPRQSQDSQLEGETYDITLDICRPVWCRSERLIEPAMS